MEQPNGRFWNDGGEPCASPVCSFLPLACFCSCSWRSGLALPNLTQTLHDVSIASIQFEAIVNMGFDPLRRI
jgi:hypothetical protein